MLELAFVLMATMFFSLIALANWRQGFLFALVVGFLQDPIRKIVPGQPVEMLGAVVGAVGLVIISLMIRGARIELRSLFGGRSAIISPLQLFILLALFQSFITVARFGSVVLAIIGMIAYLSPFPALWLAFHYPRSEADIRRLLMWYIGLSLLVSSGIYLSAMGLNMPLLGQVGTGLHAHFQGAWLTIHTGFMRTPEVAAWHAATAICCLLLLTFHQPTSRRGMGTVISSVFLIVALLLTARRKYIMEIIAFMVILATPLFYLRHQSVLRAIVGAIFGLGIFVSTALIAAPATLAEQLFPHLQRTGDAFSNAWDRFYTIGIQSIDWAISRNGWFGRGAGTGSQGSQHFGAGGWGSIGGAAEGGLGKITAELGVPALVLILWLIVALSGYLLHLAMVLSRQEPRLFRLYLGLIGIPLANLPIFISAAPVYGDPFILLMLGTFLGMALAIPRLATTSVTSTAVPSTSTDSPPIQVGQRPGFSS